MFVVACSQSCGIVFDTSHVATTAQVITWDRSWTVHGFRSSEMKAVPGMSYVAVQ